MRLGADDVSWRWIDTLGKEQSGVKWDLVALLSDGTLPPKTLVWKTGWSEWFAASRIAELADALPESSVEARLSPPSSRGVVKPPPAPVSDPRASLVDSEWGSAPPGPPAPPKPALLPEPPSEASHPAADQSASGGSKLPRPNLTPPKIVLPSERKSEPRHAKPAPPQESPPSSFGLLGLQNQKEKPKPKVVVTTQSNPFATFERSTESYGGNRPPMPTLSDEAAPATATLRPPAAVPPPPRSALGGPVLDPRVLSRLGREKSAVDTPLPLPPDSEALTTVPNRSATVGDITVDDQAVTERREALAPVQPPRAPLSREASGPVYTPQVHVLGEPRPPIPTIPEVPVSTLGDARPIQPTIPESAPSFSRPPSELTPAIIHAGPVVELGRSPAPPPPLRRTPPPNPLPPPSPPPASARPVVKPLPPPSLESTLSSGTSPAPVPPPRSAARSALSSTGSPAAMEIDARAKSAPHDAQEARPARRSKSAFLAFGGVAAACAVVSGFLLFSRRGATNEIVDAAAQSASAPPPAARLGCRIQAHPARVGAAIDRSVTPLLAPLPSGRAALGFAENPKKAIGLVISPDTLDAEPSFEKPFDQPLRSVVPLVSADKPSFFARADSAALKNPRAVDGPKPFVIGAGENAILRAASGAQPEPVWELPSKSAVTELRVASYPAGHLVTFRVGGLEGKEMVGFLNVDGTKQSELAALDTPKLVGTPFGAVSASHWVVVFAARESNQEPWHVELVTGALGSTQGSRSKFEAPPGGLGGGQIAPSIAPLARDHWLLQWTEGKTGMYQVRTLVLDAKLSPVGEPLVVSPKGASSGQGALFSAGDRSVSLYVQTIGGHDELWATTLDCR